MRRALSMSCVMATAVLPSCLTHRTTSSSITAPMIGSSPWSVRRRTGYRVARRWHERARRVSACRRRARTGRGHQRGGQADLGQKAGCVDGPSDRAACVARGARRPRSPRPEGCRTARRSGTACRYVSGVFLFVAGQGEDVGAVDLDRAFVGFQQAEDALSGGRTCRCRAAYDHHGGSGHDVEVDAVQDEFGAEGFADVTETDLRGGSLNVKVPHKELGVIPWTRWHSNPVMARLDPAISGRYQSVNDPTSHQPDGDGRVKPACGLAAQAEGGTADESQRCSA